MDYIMDFAKRDGDTLVLVTADHECGGMSVGRDNKKLFVPEILQAQDRYQASKIISYFQIGRFYGGQIIRHPGPSTYKRYHHDWGESKCYRWRIEQYPNQHVFLLVITKVLDANDLKQLQIAISTVLSVRARVGWTSLSHTVRSIPIFLPILLFHFHSRDFRA